MGNKTRKDECDTAEGEEKFGLSPFNSWKSLTVSGHRNEGHSLKSLLWHYTGVELDLTEENGYWHYCIKSDTHVEWSGWG